MRTKIFIYPLISYLGLIGMTNFLILALIAGMMGTYESMAIFFGGVLLCSILFFLFMRLHKKMEIEMIHEVAILLYPLCIFLSLAIGAGLAYFLYQMDETKSLNPLLLLFSGVLIAAHPTVKIFDIPFMRSADDLE
jgi:hypothetical protein